MKALRTALLPAAVLGLGLLLAGCTEERHSAIPASAHLVNKTTDRGAWTAPSDGTVYIDTGMGDKLFYSGQVRKGQTVTINERRNRLEIGGNTVVDRDIPGGTYRIWFKPDGTDRVTVERTHETTIRTDRD